MPNLLDASGLQTATRAELVAFYTARYQAIYGANVVLTSDSPDGQMMNIFVQSVLDLQDLLTQVYSSFDPDNAIGVTLDQRVAYNGIQRQAGTYTVTPITVVNSQSVNLYGLDQTSQDVFTVSDNAGNHWQLLTTQLGVGAGTHVYSFRAAEPGAVLTTPNTITAPITIVLGVTSVNNPTAYTTLGINEESDAVLKLRRQKSVSLASQGYLAGLKAALENINGVTSAFVFENTSGATNADGVPGHSIWAIVAGTGADSEIAQAIYTKRNAGCGMYGSSTYAITQVDASVFNVYWDTVVAQNLFMAFTATSINGTTVPSIAAIRAGLAVTFKPGANATVDINELATAVQAIDANTLVTSAGFSTALSQSITVVGTASSGVFKFECNGVKSGALNYNDSAATLQTALRLVTGLSTAVVSGSMTAGPVVITLTATPPALITISDNTMGVTFTYNEAYTNTLAPTSKRNQFVVDAANIVIMPMILSPALSAVVHATTTTVSTLGGKTPFTYSMLVNNSGGSINATTGVYTAGATVGVSDTVKVTDGFGFTATASILVT